MRGLWIRILSLIIGIIITCPSFPQDLYRQKILKLEGRVQEVHLEDLDGDSRLDLIVVHTQNLYPIPRVERILSIFLQRDGLLSMWELGYKSNENWK